MGVLRLVSIIWANEVCTFVRENVGSHFLNWHEVREGASKQSDRLKSLMGGANQLPLVREIRPVKGFLS